MSTDLLETPDDVVAESQVSRLLSESPIGLSNAAALFGSFKSGRPVHPSTMARWCMDGILVDGRRLKLESIRVAGRLLTSRAALIRFLEQQQPTADTPEPHPAPVPRSPGARDRAATRAAEDFRRRAAAGSNRAGA